MDEKTRENSPKELMAFFSTPEKPIKISEYRDFWGSLSEEEKAYYRTVEIPS